MDNPVDDADHKSFILTLPVLTLREQAHLKCMDHGQKAKERLPEIEGKLSVFKNHGGDT